jgi:hypothetical protein
MPKPIPMVKSMIAVLAWASFGFQLEIAFGFVSKPFFNFFRSEVIPIKGTTI